MQITKAKVTHVELKLRHPVRMADVERIEGVSAFFVRLETRQGQVAWGCSVAHPDLTGEQPQDALLACQRAAELCPDLPPLNVEYCLSSLAQATSRSCAAACAFDLAFYDLMGLITGLPLYRLLGGFRNKIQTSVTIPLADVPESVERACAYAKRGFRMLKIKGGQDAALDVQRVRAVHRALPDHILRLDADGGYSVEEALEVARALKNEIEMLEQPTAPADLAGLREVTLHSVAPVLADQSVSTPASALELAAHGVVNGMSVKLATCGGIRCARQIDTIARAAGIATMVSCIVEPALLIAAGLSFALSSPNVRYGDLDGHLDLENDPTEAGFTLEEGWLVARDVPGLGCGVVF